MVVRVYGLDGRRRLDQSSCAGRGCGGTGAVGRFHPYMWVSTFRANKGIWTVFLLLWITFFLLSAGDFGVVGAKILGGFVGILTDSRHSSSRLRR